MPKTLKMIDKVVFITGASRGIGKAIALRLAKEGARLIVHARSQERLHQTLSEIESLGGTAAALTGDLSIPSQVHELAENACQLYGKLDILINNAGASIKKPFYESSDEEWDFIFKVNAMAPFILCRECLPALRNSDAPSIIQIGSVVGVKGYIEQSLYGASKHALMGFTKVLAQEVQPYGVRVHSINPGGVYTDMVKNMRPDLDPSGLIQPEEIADLVHFLLTHRNNAVIDDLHLRRANGSPWY
ncbi:MAG: SDR family oxidoreductase [Candidatus Omnitrophica bacterium]|nr:SDR family oxidoreductase [Candidatus Omnitrophota bacterium]